MSARWLVELVCDGCGATSAPWQADRALYGATLAKLRETWRAVGWRSYTSAGPNQHRDYCPECAAARGSGA